MAIDEELRKQMLSKQELEEYHAPYGKEYSFYDAVARGDIAHLTKGNLPIPFSENSGLGKLSANPVRNVRYHLIISIALVCRYCIEAGLSPEIAYSISDLYIQKADICTSEKELEVLRKEVTFDYAKRMQMQKKRVYSKHVVTAMDYIKDHIQERISMEQLALVTNIHPNYLSKIFREEMKVTISTYIRERKIEAASYELKHTNISIADITSMFQFSSQSYFIQVFKKKYGSTPMEYRKSYFRRNLNHDIRSHFNEQ